MEMELRDYTEEDFADIYALDQRCFPPGIAYSKRMLRYFLRMPQGRCILARDGDARASNGEARARDGALAGFIITEEGPPVGHILTLDVAEEYRRRGVGTQLLARSEEGLASRGVTEIVIETSVESAVGVAFWHGHGFLSVGVLPRYYLGKIDAYEMRKKIARA
jgi:ribosomal-protein-alanine N-acetyltransferase